MTNDDRIRRLAGLIKLYRGREQALAGRMRAARDAHAQQEAQLGTIDGLRTEYRERLSSEGTRGVTGAALKNWRRFMQGLEELRREQSARSERSGRARDLRHEAWLAQHQRVKGLESFDERLVDERDQARARAEQKRLDDVAARRHRTSE